MVMLREYFCRKSKALWAWGGLGLLLSSLYVQVYMSVLFNKWYGAFYDILGNLKGYTVNDFWDSLFYFSKLAITYVGLTVVTNWFTRKYSFEWRKAITFDYIPKWRRVKEEVEGASQRIQEDAYRFARIVESLGLQVVRAIMTLVAFLPLLYDLSNHIVLKVKDWVVPVIGEANGNLVWLAIIASIGGMVISWFVGYYLPGLEYNNQKVEAAFRKELVLGEDDKEGHASLQTLTELFTGLQFNYNKLFWHYGYFDLWSSLYDQIMIILPYIIAAPSLFAGLITLGVLVQISNAFNKVYNSFSLFIQNWTTITELRSIWKRLHEFERNIKRFNKGV